MRVKNVIDCQKLMKSAVIKLQSQSYLFCESVKISRIIYDPYSFNKSDECSGLSDTGGIMVNTGWTLPS